MKKRTYLLILFIITLFGVPASYAAGGLQVARIGIVTDGDWARYPDQVEIFMKEIRTAASGEFDIRFHKKRTLSGNWDIDTINDNIDTLLKTPSVDAVIALGHVSSYELCKRRNLKKPVIASFIINDEVENLPKKGAGTGVKNLNYINARMSIDRSVQELSKISPFKNLTLIADSFVLNAIPELDRYIRQYAGRHNLNIYVVEAETSAAKIIERIPDETQAVMFSSLPRISDDEFKKLSSELIIRKIPSFSFWGQEDLQAGILASMTTQDNIEHIARSTAINMLDILRGESAASLATTFDAGEQLKINMATARAIGVTLGWDHLTGADLINDSDNGSGRDLSLDKAVKEALEVNLSILAADRNVAAGEEAVRKSRSALLPQVAIETEARVIDSDRAEASLGQNPERTWTGSAGVSQLIYSDRAWTNYTVNKYSQQARMENREAVKLDITEAAAVAYLNVLKTNTLLKIQKNNLRLTRKNLDRARVRVSVGAAGPEEVYRWESEIANRRQEVLVAESAMIDAKNNVNLILNRQLTEDFSPVETDLKGPRSVLKDDRILSYLESPKKLFVYSNFLMEEAKALSPELRRIGAEISARERALVSAKREFWLPTFELNGGVVEMFDKSGKGDEYPTSDSPDDTNWSVGVTASLPLFNSGGKTAQMRQTREELEQLKIESSSLADRIDQKTLAATNRVRASFPSIKLSQDAAKAAENNLEIITSAYERGVVSIIDLLDAQNLALTADQKAANTVHNFLIDLMMVQRAVGEFFLFEDDAKRDMWFSKTEEFFHNQP